MKTQINDLSMRPASVLLTMAFGLLCAFSAQVANAQDISAQYSFDSSHKIRDITVPAGYAYLYLEVNGATGGKGTDKSYKGGAGAFVSGYVKIGNGAGAIPVGSTLRLIPGQAGGIGKFFSGGGGGSGAAFKGPNANDPWQLLAVAGGGGGTSNGKNGKAATSYTNGLDGEDANGKFLRNAGKDGNGGTHPGVVSYPGGGVFTDGAGGCPGRAGFQNNVPTGGEGGSTGCGKDGDMTVRGGFGFGGGGSGIGPTDASNHDFPGSGGGGGGYSGGGGGADYSTYPGDSEVGGPGGGGGSYANTDLLVMQQLKSFDIADPQDGYVKYRFTNTSPFKSIRLAKDATKCIDLSMGKTAIGTNLQLDACGNTSTSQWGFYGTNLRPEIDFNKCIDLTAGNTSNGTNIELWGCVNDNKNQDWVYDGFTQNIHSGVDPGKCLQLENAKIVAGAKVQLSDCRSINAQRWTVDGMTIPTLAATYNNIQSVLAPDKCIDVKSAQTANGTNIQLYQCHFAAAQYWHFDGNTIRYYQDQGKCLDLNQSKTDNGTNIQLFDCNGTKAQQWIYDAADGVIRSSVNLYKCLDIDQSKTADGTNIQLWDCNGTDAQRFVIGN